MIVTEQAMMNSQNWPSQITLKKDRRAIWIDWENGDQDRIEAALLRQHSPSAETKGHSHSPKSPPALNQDVTIVGVEPVGNYAVRLKFCDGHSTGIYQWAYLKKLADKTQ